MRVEKKQGRLRRWVARRIFQRREKFSPLLGPEGNHEDDDDDYSSEEGEQSDKYALSTLKSKDTATATRSHTSQDDSLDYSTSRRDTGEQRRVRSDLSAELAAQRQRQQIPFTSSTSYSQSSRYQQPNAVPAVLHCDHHAQGTGRIDTLSSAEDILSAEDVTIEFAEADSDSQQNYQGTEVLLSASKDTSILEDHPDNGSLSMNSGSGPIGTVWDIHHRNAGHQKGGLFLSFNELGLESMDSHDTKAKPQDYGMALSQHVAPSLNGNSSSSNASTPRKPVLHHQLSASSMSLVESNKTADRSASSVTWVSHEDDFDNTDMRPLREITLEYSPKSDILTNQSSATRLRSSSEFSKTRSDSERIELVNSLIFGKSPMMSSGRDDIPTERSSSLNRPRESSSIGDSASHSKRRIRSYDEALVPRGRVIPIINRATGAESFDDEVEQINRKIIEPPSLKTPTFHHEVLSPMEPYKNQIDLSRRENTILEETLSLTDDDEDEHFEQEKQVADTWRPMPSVKVVIQKEKRVTGQLKKMDSFDPSTSMDEVSENSSRVASRDQRRHSRRNRRDRRSRGRAESSIESSLDDEYDDEYDDEEFDDGGVGLECGFLDDVVALDDEYSASRATQSYATTTAGQSNATPSVATSNSGKNSGRASSPVYEKRRGPSSGKNHTTANSTLSAASPKRTSRTVRQEVQRRNNRNHVDSTKRADRRHRNKERGSSKKSFLESIEDVARDSTCMVMDFFHSRK